MLVGAGPGDPGLITVAGANALAQAQVLVYDALVNPQLLSLAPEHAERIDAGKRAREHRLTQDQTNALLAEKAAEGKLVVRLKGGDPYLFGRGAEEVAYLASRGISCQVIPGITAGIAAPAYAGIPVTHRSCASCVAFVTGHEDPGKDQTSLDYAALARLIASGGTVCFYMGVSRLAHIVAELRSHGLAGDVPAAVVQWGTLARQRSVRATLDDIAQAVLQAGIAAPAIIVAGQVAGMHEPGLDFFTNQPLFGQRILVTRTRQQASELRLQLEALGADVIEAPTIELVEPEDWSKVDQALREIGEYHWLVLTSANGVKAIAQRLSALNLDARQFAGIKLAAIGDATAQAMQEHLGLRADFIPTRFVAESLAGELIAQQNVAGQRFLLLRADISRPALPKLLTEAGALVTELTAYQTRKPAALDPAALAALRAGEVHWVTFTSSSTAANLVELLGSQRHLLDRCKLASIGPITSQTMRELGLTPTLEAEVSTVEGLVAAITKTQESSKPEKQEIGPR